MALTLASEQRPLYATPLLIAALVLALVIGAAFYFNPHHTADLSIAHTDIFAPQTTFKAPAGALHVIGQAPQTEQDLYVVATVHLQDDLRLPLFLDEVEGTYVMADGSSIHAVAPAAPDLERMEEIFPRLKAMMPHPLLLGDTVPPRSAVDGQVLLHFGNTSAEDWTARKPSTLTIHFTHQDPMTVAIP